MIVSEQGAIVDQQPQTLTFPLALRIAARIVSFVFHPLFIPLYVCLFFIYEARLFPTLSKWEQTKVFIQFVIYYTFFPLVALLLAKGVGFIDSIYLRTRKDRILPFVICEIFYFWAWYVFRNIKYFPDEVEMFGLAVFLACSLGLIFNAYFKISMHGIALGVATTLFFIMAYRGDKSFGAYLSIALLATGLTATARLIDSDHSPKEIYFGIFVGVLMQVVASYFV